MRTEIEAQQTEAIMNSKAVTEKISREIAAMGIPAHLWTIKRVPSKVVATAVIGGRVVEVEAISGTTQSEIEHRLGNLRGLWSLHQGGQKDLVVEAAE